MSRLKTVIYGPDFTFIKDSPKASLIASSSHCLLNTWGKSSHKRGLELE